MFHQGNLPNQFGKNNRNTESMPRASHIAGRNDRLFLKRLKILVGLNSVGVSLSGYSSVAGIPPYILQRIGIEGPITNKIFVANVICFDFLI